MVSIVKELHEKKKWFCNIPQPILILKNFNRNWQNVLFREEKVFASTDEAVKIGSIVLSMITTNNCKRSEMFD